MQRKINLSSSITTLFLLVTFLCQPFSTFSQIKGLDLWLDQEMPKVIDRHRAFVSLPNDAHFPADMVKNAEWLKREFEQRGLGVAILEAGPVPVVLAEKKVDPALPTVLFYFHYDGQPVAPSKWDQKHPFTPVLKMKNEEDKWEIIDWSTIEEDFDPDWRIFGRAAADDKGPISMMLTAFDFINANDLPLAFNVKILFDGEEEKGSNGLLGTLNEYKTKYAADQLIIMDGPAHPSNRPTLTFGCRGIASGTLTVYGPKVPQHSGHFGNYAPNPIFRMSHLLASMKSEDGKVVIKGFYDNIKLDKGTRAILAAVPDNAGMINNRIGVAKPESVGENYQESLQYPSLNVRGMSSAWIGRQTRTIVPDKAVAQIGIRLVPETDGDHLLDLLREHIKDRGYYLIDREPTEEERLEHEKIATFVGSKWVNAFRTEIESPTGKWLTSALEGTFNSPPVNIRIMGGTVPVTPLIEALGIPAVIVPMVNMDNNQHSPNENLRLGNLRTGIKTCLAILTTAIPNP